MEFKKKEKRFCGFCFGFFELKTRGLWAKNRELPNVTWREHSLQEDFCMRVGQKQDKDNSDMEKILFECRYERQKKICEILEGCNKNILKTEESYCQP